MKYFIMIFIVILIGCKNSYVKNIDKSSINIQSSADNKNKNIDKQIDHIDSISIELR